LVFDIDIRFVVLNPSLHFFEAVRLIPHRRNRDDSAINDDGRETPQQIEVLSAPRYTASTAP